MPAARVLWLIWCGVWALAWALFGFAFIPFWLMVPVSVAAMFVPVGKPRVIHVMPPDYHQPIPPPEDKL
jgi:hypothetical protein